MADHNPLPVTVIGGYLGAGKTTLLNALLRQAAQQSIKLAILVNDFGDVAIDADLIEGEGESDSVLQLAGGCVCCTIGSDLTSALVSLPDTIGETDHILIETSGVAMPGTGGSNCRSGEWRTPPWRHRNGRRTQPGPSALGRIYWRHD